MKLVSAYSVGLLAIFATSMIAKAQDDAEDVEAEVLDEEDDVEIEDEEDVVDNITFDDGPEFIPGHYPDLEVEGQPKLMDTPLTGVKTFLYYPDGAHTITGGKVSDAVIGIQNNGDADIEIISVNGKMTYPDVKSNEVVQNFTNSDYGKQVIGAKSEASLSFSFMPSQYTGGRDFNIAIEVFYKKTGNINFYKSMPFNQVVNVNESAEGVAMEIFFMYSTLLFLAIFGGLYFYQTIVIKKLGLVKPTKVETGTSNQEINMEWIDGHKGHTGLKKRSMKKSN
jgi:hypothetical protein